jgi:hypothetical protein
VSKKSLSQLGPLAKVNGNFIPEPESSSTRTRCGCCKSLGCTRR